MTLQSNRSKASIACLILLVMVAIYIRVDGANAYHYYGDEWMIVQIANGLNLLQVLHFSVFETHPPLLYVLLHYWIKISDAPEFVRSFSLFFGIALIPLYYHIGKKLSGELMGICCATLIVFSHACIIQSYIVRQYALLLFLLSSTFYFYLFWRDEKKSKYLLGYILFACLACLTHFSAIYAIFCITLYEIARMRRNASCFECAKWLCANAIMGALFLFTLLIWNDSLLPMHNAVGGVMASLNLNDKIMLALSYPFYLSSYVFPGAYFIIVLLLLLPLAVANKKETALFWLAGTALLLGIFLLFTGIYPFAGDRHSLWAMPFIIITAGQIMANAVGYAQVRLKFDHILFLPALTIILCLFFYDPVGRFLDLGEYRIKTPEWNDIQDALNKITSSDLLVASRVEAAIFASTENNMYSYFENNNFAVSSGFGYAPYYNTHILFNNRREVRVYDTNGFTQMLQHASSKRILDTYDNLTFVHSYGLNGPVVDLITCAALDKKVVSFPANSHKQNYTKMDIINADVIFLTVKKDDFFNQVIAANGKAHSCLLTNL